VHQTAKDTFGMISGKTNMLSSPCNSINKTVPYFKDWEQDNHKEFGDKYPTIDHYLFEHLDNLQETHFDYTDRNFDDNVDV